MNILHGIGAANALLRNATGLVRAIKAPRVDKEAFAAMLQKELGQTASPDAIRAKLTEASEQHVRLRDADADGLLTRNESGLNKNTFARLDADGDGFLSAAELRAPYLERLESTEA